MQPEFIQKQYRRLARYYDAHRHYAEQFVPMLSVCMVDKLNLRNDDRLLDLGGGTGIYTRAILELVGLQQPVTIVDPVAEMLAQVPSTLPVERVEMDALAYSRMPGVFDKVLMKGAVEYVDDKAELFSNLHTKLSRHGVLLVVNTPPSIDHPLFESARDRSRTWYVDSQLLLELLEEAGFEVELESLDYESAIPRYEYFQMIRERYLSLLASFTDEELEAGIAEIEDTLVDDHALEFTDRFDFLTAAKVE